jgi:hypothetical protein
MGRECRALRAVDHAVGRDQYTHRALGDPIQLSTARLVPEPLDLG